MTTEAKSSPKRSSSVAEFGPRRLDCCSLMEPEPGRCRRTDGKKWRCKNDVVPNTKYCERHIHRGCNRSRKLVEGSSSNQTASRPSMTSQPPQRASSYATPLLLRPLPRSDSTKNLENLCDVSIAASKDARANSSDPTSASTMVGLGFKPTHNLVAATLGGSKRSPSSENLVFTHSVELVDAAYNNGIGKKHKVVTGSSKVPFDSMAATSSIVTGRKIMTKDVDFASPSCATSTSKNSQAIFLDSVTKRTTSIRDIDKLKVNTSQRFNFSPKSVLHHANDHHPNPSIQGCSPSCFYRSDSEVQPWRCRRTDGRKWRCQKDVLPCEKYCAMHMHRGAKKQVQNSQLADLPSSKRSKATHSHLNLNLSSKEKYTSLNTNLSISALEISQPTEDYEPSTTGGSSDATISDDITSYENN